jgi:hypothetical protein
MDVSDRFTTKLQLKQVDRAQTSFLSDRIELELFETNSFSNDS